MLLLASLVLAGCEAQRDTLAPVRYADLTARQPSQIEESGSPRQASFPLLFPGSGAPDAQPGLAAGERRAMAGGASETTQGIDVNFEGAEIAQVAKVVLGDVLGLDYLVDSRVQGSITLASASPIPRETLLPALESALRLSNVALVREGRLVKLVPAGEAGGAGALAMGTGEPGFGVSIVPFRFVSAQTVSRVAENFLSRPGAVRVDPARNLLLIQGTSQERRSAVQAVASFDVEWMRNQSVGIYPLKSTSPETMIAELERIFQTGEGGLGQDVVRFQPISRMNAVMAVARSPRTLDRTTRWIQRLDRSDTSGTTLRTYRVKYGEARRLATILNEIFAGRRAAGGGEGALDQIAPGSRAGQARLDALTGPGSSAFGPRSAAPDGKTTGSARTGSGTEPGREGFDDRLRTAFADAGLSPGGGSGAQAGRGPVENVRITADTVNNAIVIFSNQEDYRVIERALLELDRPPLQVAIEATIAEVTLTEDLRFGVQVYLSSKDLGLRGNRGSVGLFQAAQTAAQAAALSRVLPGFNLLLGPEAQPRLVLDALSSLTDVKVLSSPSLVVIDNQPAVLQVGDEVPISTRSATSIDNPTAPIVNNIEFRNTGVILKVLPRVNANGVVQLDVEQEISNVVNKDEQTLTPTISQRRVRSTIAVTSGQTVLLGGLISERNDSNRSGVPGLRQIKWLGDLFGKTLNTGQRTELIIFIKPQVIRDSVDGQIVAEEFRDRLESLRSSDRGDARAFRPSRPGGP